jgi:tetratricopeptide (TPR) repeat protein
VVTRHDAQGQDTVELIHEALLRHWPPLRQWVAENRQFRLWQNRLRQALDDWQHHGQDPGALLRGARLVEAEDWLHRQGERLSPPEQHFIQVSLNERERVIQARRRNQHRLIAGLTAGLIGALSLAGYAWIQRNRAEQASEVAILARGQAEDLINYMLFELRDKLQPIGRVDLLDGASRKAAEYFETLPAPEASAASERNRGVALDNIGDVRQTQGDLSGARAAYEAGLVIAERLARQDPANTVLQRDLTVSYNKIGEVCQAQGDLTAARAAYEAGLAITERQTRQDPADAAWQRDLSISHNKIGDLRLAEGDLLGAQAAYEAGLAIAERLARQDPANVVWQRDLSISHNQIGDVRLAQGDLAGAQAAYETSLTVIERLARQDQANTGWQRDLWLSHNLIGDVLQAKDDLPGAQTAYEAGLAIIERLARQDPGNAGWQRDLAVSHNQIGRVRKAQGDLAGARVAYEADLAIAEGLARQDPANAEWQHDLWVSRNQIGEIRKAQGDLAGARTAYEEGLAIAERLTRQAPANAGWQRDLALSHNQIGTVLQAQGDLTGAREAFQRELAILLPLATRTEAPEESLLFGNVYDRLVTVSTAQGDIRAALTYQRDWVEQVRKTADQSDLAESLWVLYGLEDQAGNNRDALAVNTEVLTLARDLYQRQQDDDRRQFLAEVLGNRAFTLLLDRQPTAAIAAAEEGMALDPNQGWIIINQAHGYLLSGQVEKARAIYREHMRDTVYDHQTFPETVFDDFVRLRQSGLGHPDMEKIEALLKVSEKPRATSKTRKQ